MNFGLKRGLLSLFFLQGYSEMKMKIKEQQRSNRGLQKEIREKGGKKEKKKKQEKKNFFLIEKNHKNL